MARKLFATLEDEQLFVTDDQPVEMDMLETDEEIQDVVEQVEGAEQAEAVAETIAEIEAAETPEEAVAIAIEHLTRSIGYTKKYSTESFKIDLEQRLVISQEGMMGRIGNAIKRTFTSDKKLKLKLKTGLETLKEKGPKTEVLKDPSWSKYLAIKGKDTVTGAEAISFVKEIYGKIEGDKTVKDLATITSELIKLSAIKDGNFSSEDSTAFSKSISSLKEKMSYFSDSLKMKYTNSDKDSYPDFTPLTYKEAETLSSFIKENLAVEKNYEMLVEIANSKEETYVKGEQNVFTLLMNLMVFINKFRQNKETKQFNNILGDVEKLTITLTEILVFYTRMSYAIIRYIESSAAK